MRASAQAQLPVILQISHNCADYHGGLEPIALATLAISRRAQTPVAVHLDHAERPELVGEAVALGFGSVMFDGGALPYEENVAITAAVTQNAHAAGVYVEGELGEVGGKDGAHAPGVRTDPDEARAFVEATGVDALAMASSRGRCARSWQPTLISSTLESTWRPRAMPSQTKRRACSGCSP